MQLELIDVVLSLLIDRDGEQSMKSFASNEKGSASGVGSCLYEILPHSNCLAVQAQSVQPVTFAYGENAYMTSVLQVWEVTQLRREGFVRLHTIEKGLKYNMDDII